MDSWALGVLLYTLVYGTMPFDGGDHKNLIRQISNGEYKEPTQSSGTAYPLRKFLIKLRRREIKIVFLSWDSRIIHGLNTILYCIDV